MSDDLISRKDLLGTEQLLMSDIVKNNPTARYILEQVLYDIENAPTAYDVDKVIEQLEKLISKEYEKPKNCDENGFGDGEEIYEDGRTQGKYEAYKKALEIVKAGGVTND